MHRDDAGNSATSAAVSAAEAQSAYQHIANVGVWPILPFYPNTAFTTIPDAGGLADAPFFEELAPDVRIDLAAGSGTYDWGDLT